MGQGSTIYKIGSGRYSFESQLQNNMVKDAFVIKLSIIVYVILPVLLIGQNNITLSVRQSIADRQLPASDLWYEGIPLGNGDLGMIAYGADNRLTFAVGKNDFWDRRYDNDVKSGKEYRPQPKPVCKIRIWQPSTETESGMKSLRPLTHRLSLEDAELTTSTANFSVVSRVQKDQNLVIIRLSGIKQKTIISLYRSADTTNSDIANPVYNAPNGIGSIIQDMPPERTYPKGFRCAVAAKLSKGSDPEINREGITWLVTGDCILSVAVVTTRDHIKPLSRSQEIISNMTDNESLWQSHKTEWKGFWDKSWMNIDDEEIQAMWYNYNYLLASATKPGAIAPGLFSPWIVNDESAWRGSYTIDYNFQQTYCAALSSNHPELMEPYFETVEEALPNAREIAKELYGKEGITFPHEMFPVKAKGKLLADNVL